MVWLRRNTSGSRFSENLWVPLWGLHQTPQQVC
jgi:hypothetical protein